MDEVVENDSVTASEDVVTDVVEELSDVERQRNEYLDALQRLQADFENYRKRVARDADTAAVRAASDLVSKLLPVLDAFDYARAHFGVAGSEETLAFEQARGLLLDTLAKEGLERIVGPGGRVRPPGPRCGFARGG